MPGDVLHLALGIAGWLLGVNSLAMIAFYHDKRMAQLGERRISERTLLTIALIGGSIGALVARQRFRHKTRKQPFSAQLYAICALQVFAIIGIGVFGLQGIGRALATLMGVQGVR